MSGIRRLAIRPPRHPSPSSYAPLPLATSSLCISLVFLRRISCPRLPPVAAPLDRLPSPHIFPSSEHPELFDDLIPLDSASVDQPALLPSADTRKMLRSMWASRPPLASFLRKPPASAAQPGAFVQHVRIRNRRRMRWVLLPFSTAQTDWLTRPQKCGHRGRRAVRLLVGLPDSRRRAADS